MAENPEDARHRGEKRWNRTGVPRTRDLRPARSRVGNAGRVRESCGRTVSRFDSDSVCACSNTGRSAEEQAPRSGQAARREGSEGDQGVHLVVRFVEGAENCEEFALVVALEAGPRKDVGQTVRPITRGRRGASTRVFQIVDVFRIDLRPSIAGNDRLRDRNTVDCRGDLVPAVGTPPRRSTDRVDTARAPVGEPAQRV